MSKFEIVMGLEVHVELATKTKIFCSCPTTFGAEPKDYEVWEYVLRHYHGLKFSPAVEADTRQRADNPKRRQREAGKQMERSGVGTKSQQALQMQLDMAVYEEMKADLAKGKHVVLFYEYKAERNAYQLPGALERFKPCIWDRGSNLGGVISTEGLQKVLASGRYFDMNLQPLLEAGTKVNLDSCPFAVSELFSGIDKPVRDRMKGLRQGIKHFIDEDTLRKFSHLFSVKVGEGTLIVCTFRLQAPESPVVSKSKKTNGRVSLRFILIKWINHSKALA